MADKSISELTAASAVNPSDLFVLEQNSTAKKLTGQTLENWLVSFADGHGGIQSIEKTSTSGTNPVVDTYTITLADTTTATFTVTNGLKGDKGDQTYLWIRYASKRPTANSDMGDTPDKWIGIYSGTSATAPVSYTSYSWYEIKGATGDPAVLNASEVKYQAGANGTDIPYGEWSDTPPTVTPGRWLWTRTTLTFNSGTPTVFYTAARQGIDGSGAAGEQLPLMDGTASVGASTSFAREDHVHPITRYRTFLTVGSRDADFTTINDAISYCKTNSVTNACILIQSGTYRENIELLGASGICLYGIGKVSIVNADAAYPKAALYATGDAQFYNIEFISQDNATDAYGLHIEGMNESSPTTMRFYNCMFQSSKNAGAGIGTGSYYDLEFNDCRFYSNPNSGLFIHNYGATDFQGFAVASFLNCRFTSTDIVRDITIHDAFKMAGLSGSSPLLLTFANCTATHGKIGYAEQSGVYLGYLPATAQIVLDAESQSDILGVNYTLRTPNIGGIIQTTPGGVFTYPFANADKYDITITSALNESNVNILSGCSIDGKTNSFFVGHVPAGSGVCNMNFTATPSL